MRWPDLASALQRLDLGNAKVAHANGSGLAFGIQPLKGTPDIAALVDARAGRVDQKQVDVAPDAMNARETGGVRLISRVARGKDLGCDKELVTGKAALGERKADFALVGIILGRVDVAVACLDSGQA